MIPTKIDTNSSITITEKNVEYVVDWFEQNKQKFYTIGWTYFRSQQQMEEVFFRSILKVHKEIPRFKSDKSFESWVTSIFIDTCRELSEGTSLPAYEESGKLEDVFKAMTQMKENEREGIAFAYGIGISVQEAAHHLQVSEDKFKELLLSGIQSLRKEMGDAPSISGCKEYHKDYIDYLERNLERSKKINLEKHVYHCQNCQEDLGTFQGVMYNLIDKFKEFQVPSGFMDNIKGRLAEKEKERQLRNRKRKRTGFIFAGIFTLLLGIGTFTGVFTNFYYSWTEENQELLPYLQEGLGERLNLEAESKGVKIKITSVIADDIQTLVFYEIEDIEENNQYMMNYHDGVIVKNEHEIMSHDTYPRYYPPDFESEQNNAEKSVFRGKMSLLPIKSEEETIQLKVSTLQKLNLDASNRIDFYGNVEYQTGEWNFEIPVTKQPSIEYTLDEETEVEGIPVRFDKLTIAPTTTILEYGIHNHQSEKRIEVLNFDYLEVNDRKVKADLYGGSYVDSYHDMNWSTYQTDFDPLFGEKAKEFKVQLGSIYLSFEDQKNIDLDAGQSYPQTFEYAGSTISIDKLEVGEPTQLVISNHEIENRAYDSLQFQIVDENGNGTNSMEMESEGVLVDKSGNEYEMNEIPIRYEDIEHPRYFQTVQKLRLYSEKAGGIVIPKRLEIFGYQATKYSDDTIELQMK